MKFLKVILESLFQINFKIFKRSFNSMESQYDSIDIARKKLISADIIFGYVSKIERR